MHLSVFAAVFIGVGLISSSASAASLTLGLSTIDGGVTYGTAPGTPLIVVPAKSSISGENTFYTMTALLNSPNEGTFNNVSLSVTLPPGIVLDQTFAGSFTFVSCTVAALELPRTCTWTRPSMAVAGASGATAGIVFKATALRFRDGQDFQLSATLSAASFTPVGGGSESVTPGSATFYAQASTTAGLFVGINQNGLDLSSSGWGYGPDGVTNGHLSVHSVSVSTASSPTLFTQNIIDDVSITISLPAGSVFTALHMPTVPAGWTLSPRPNPGDPLVLNWNDSGLTNPWRPFYPAAGGAGSANTYSAGQGFSIVAFAPCDRFDENTAVEDILVTGTVLAHNAAGDPMTQLIGTMGAGAVAVDSPSASFLPVWSSPTSPPANANWCVDTTKPPEWDVIQGGTFTKGDNQGADLNQAIAGVPQSYFLTLRRPVGEAGLDDVYLVDRLPDGLWSPTGGAVIVGAPAPFVVYACDFSGRTEEAGPAQWVNFEPDEVDPTTDLDCDALTGSGTGATTFVVPPGMTPTHIIAIADQLGATSGTAWAGLNTIGLSVSVTFPIGYVGFGSSNEARNQAWVFGGYTDQGTPKVMADYAGLPLDDYETSGVEDGTHNASFNYNGTEEGEPANDNNTWDWGVVSPTVRGEALSIVIRQPVTSTLPVNTPIAVALPGESPNSFHAVFPFNGIAPLLPTSPIFTIEVPPGVIIVSSTFLGTPGASASGTTITGSGVGGCDAPSTPPTFSQSGSVATGYILTWTSTDPDFTLNDPVAVAGICAAAALELAVDPNFVPPHVDGDEITFTSTLFNNVGVDPLDSESTTRPLGLPPAVDFGAALSCGPVGTIHVEATIENNGGQPLTTITSRLVMPDSVNQTAVIASIQPGSLGAYDSATFGAPSGGEVELAITWTAPPALAPFTTDTFTIDVPWSGGNFTLVASGTVIATDLNGTESVIPTTSDEIRTLDACPGQLIVSKTFGNGGPAMAGVSFTLEGNGVNATQVTNGSGTTTFVGLAAGNYTLTENMGNLPGTAVWTSTLVPGATFDVASFATTNVPVANTCSCNDSNACTVDSDCTIQGACSYSQLDCSGTTVGACEAVACDPEVGCVAEPEPPIECAPPQNGWIFYVALAGTPAKQLRCVVYDDQPNAAPTCAIIDGNQCGN